MATIARTMPAATRSDGRSPSATAASTGIATAQTAVVGATTAIVPIASARYNSATPMPPKTPAATPHQRSPVEGCASGRNGIIAASSRRPASCETMTTATVVARREARPPRKSAAPYRAAEASARKYSTPRSRVALQRECRHPA